MPDLYIEIITPYKVTFSGDAKSITIPGTQGSFQVLFNHAPIISTFEIGFVKVIIPNNDTLFFATGGGTVEVNNNKILVLADSLEEVTSIDIERAGRAMERAKKRIEEKLPETDLERAQSSLKRALNRILVVEKYLPKDSVNTRVK
ncbi:MAG: ATP synthase F1 subunit epsilon [Ignavibacteriaceae bacterium]|nr:ATP synthase F1 subunit epsilon [Ignavibacteriaceae bacterium]